MDRADFDVAEQSRVSPWFLMSATGVNTATSLFEMDF